MEDIRWLVDTLFTKGVLYSAGWFARGFVLEVRDRLWSTHALDRGGGGRSKLWRVGCGPSLDDGVGGAAHGVLEGRAAKGRAGEQSCQHVFSSSVRRLGQR